MRLFIVELRPDTNQHEAAYEFKAAHHQISSEYYQSEHQQRCFVTAGKDSVIDLQHVEGRYQHQHVDDGTEHSDSSESCLEATKNFGNLVLRNLASGHYLFILYSNNVRLDGFGRAVAINRQTTREGKAVEQILSSGTNPAYWTQVHVPQCSDKAIKKGE
jgi:hypothetical protein